MEKEFFVVAGQSITLDDIEHKILRPLGDPRIHAAINCASKGCPPLQSFAFQGKQLDAQLDLSFCRNGWLPMPIFYRHLNCNSIRFFSGSKKILQPTENPFQNSTKLQGVVGFIIAYSDGDTQKELRERSYKITFSEYDWQLNGM